MRTLDEAFQAINLHLELREAGDLYLGVAVQGGDHSATFVEETQDAVELGAGDGMGRPGTRRHAGGLLIG